MNRREREQSIRSALEDIHASDRQWAYASAIGERVMTQDNGFIRRYRVSSAALKLLFGKERPDIPAGSSYEPKLRAPLSRLVKKGVVESKVEEIPRIGRSEPREMFRLVQ